MIVRRKELDAQKAKIKDLSAQYRALSTSYSVQNRDVKELEGQMEAQGAQIKELEGQVLYEQQNALDSMEREQALLQENAALRGSLEDVVVQRVAATGEVAVKTEETE